MRGSVVHAGVNVVVVRGRLTRLPTVRDLPSGSRVVSYEVSVPSSEEGRPAESVPVVWSSAPVGAEVLEAGSEIVVIGRVRRRFFRAGGVTQSRTEVVATQVTPTRKRATSQRLLAAAAGELAALVS